MDWLLYVAAGCGYLFIAVLSAAMLLPNKSAPGQHNADLAVALVLGVMWPLVFVFLILARMAGIKVRLPQ